MAARRIATAESCEFWQIGGDVYRVTDPTPRDIHGLPMSRRWECTLTHWQRFRIVYKWANDD